MRNHWIYIRNLTYDSHRRKKVEVIKPVDESALSVRQILITGSISLVIQHLTDFGSKGLRGKWFLNEVSLNVQDAVMGDNVVGVAGHVEHF